MIIMKLRAELIDIHRLGRTARAGQTGMGLIVLAPYENFFLRSKGIKELNLEPWQSPAAGTNCTILHSY